MSVQKIYVVFTKKWDMVFISHLDLMRLFQRALRRSGLPFYLTRGYNPHPKISIKKALKLGVESESEEALFYMERHVESKEFINRLEEQFPEGIRILSCENRY